MLWILLILPLYVSGLHQQQQCEPITVPMCSQGDFAYRMTTFPNYLGHRNQQEAGFEMSLFDPLIRVQCSDNIRLFLCSVFTPACSVFGKPIPPCRNLCLTAKKDCSGLMKKFAMEWPQWLDCDRFPQDSTCIRDNYVPVKTAEYICPLEWKSNSMDSKIVVRGKIIEKCTMSCQEDDEFSTFLTTNDRRSLNFWLLFGSTICFLTTFLTILTFLIDLSRFDYPLRPILYLSFCYLVLALVYLLGAFGKLSCSSTLISQGFSSSPCLILGAVHYFFQVSSSTWIFIFGLSWLLTSKFQWSVEAVAKLAPYFHTLAWGGPLGATGVAVAMRSVDGDVFTGLCSVGNLFPDHLLYFIVIPSTALLSLGFLLLLISILSMWCIHSDLHRQQPKIDLRQMEKLTTRLIIFTFFYFLAELGHNAVLYLQAVNFNFWLDGYYGQKCSAEPEKFGFSSPSDCPIDTYRQQPDLIFFLVKYGSKLVAGPIYAIWILSTKTAKSFNCFGQRPIQFSDTESTIPDY